MYDKSHQEATRYIHDRLGRETILALHKENYVYDALALIVVWSLILSLIVLLGTLPFGLVWFCCFILQGFALQLLAFISHDLFNHRQVGGPLVTRIGSMLCLTPLLFSATAVIKTHHEHHRYFGTEDDSEAYKKDLDRRWVKLLFLSFPGILLVINRKLSRESTTDLAYMGKARHRDSETVRKIAFDQKIVMVFFAGMLVLGFFWPSFIFLGYFLPLLFATPLASTCRTILEHADIQPGNPYNSSTFYKTGFLSRLLFFWSSGDCHIVHHFFPTIPFYRMNDALKLMNPIFQEHGAIEQRSFITILYRWFIENKTHGTNWMIEESNRL